MERGLVFFLRVWFLLSGWVTVEVWNVVRQWVGWVWGTGQRQGAGVLAKGPKAQGHQQPSQNRGLGWHTELGFHPTLVCWSQRPLVLSSPGEGDRFERTRETKEEGRGLEVEESMVQISSSVKWTCLIQAEASVSSVKWV